MTEEVRMALREVRSGILDVELRGSEGLDEMREIRAELLELASKAKDHIDYVVRAQGG